MAVPGRNCGYGQVTAKLSRGRGKLGSDPVRMLFEHAAGPAGEDGAAGVWCCGLRDGAFPQVRWVAAAESGTGSMPGAAMARYTDAEQPLATDLLGCFGPGMLVLADRQFLSWSLARAVLATAVGFPQLSHAQPPFPHHP